MIKLTKADFKKFAPNADARYVEALFANIALLRNAGVLDNKYRLACFFGTVAAETDSLTLTRESLDYTHVAAVRNAWPARAAKHSDEWIAENLLNKPIPLGDWAYGGRMGNRKGTSDGYDYRGGGWCQTTGREAVAEYCKKLGVEITQGALDDYALTLKFAILEWTEGKCNAYADKCDVTSIAKIINTGSATSGVKPNGMARRKSETDRALKIWADAGEVASEPIVVDVAVPDAPVPVPAVAVPSVPVVPGEAPRVNPEIITVSPAKVAVTSKSVWATIGLVFQYCFDWVGWLVNLLPEISTSVDGLMAPLANLSNAAKINVAGVSTVVVIWCAYTVVKRHSVDKAAKQTLEQVQG